MIRITILPNIDAIKKLFTGLIIKIKIKKMEIIVHIETFFVPFEYSNKELSLS